MIRGCQKGSYRIRNMHMTVGIWGHRIQMLGQISEAAKIQSHFIALVDAGIALLLI